MSPAPDAIRAWCEAALLRVDRRASLSELVEVVRRCEAAETRCESSASDDDVRSALAARARQFTIEGELVTLRFRTPNTFVG